MEIGDFRLACFNARQSAHRAEGSPAAPLPGVAFPPGTKISFPSVMGILFH